MQITIHKSQKRRLTLQADNADDHDFLNVVVATFFEGGQLRAFPNETDANAIALDPCKVTKPKKRKSKPRA
jgi:hypothetical protein